MTVRTHRTPTQRREFRRARQIFAGDVVRRAGTERVLGTVVGFPTYSERMVTIFGNFCGTQSHFDTPWDCLEVVPE